MRIHHAVLFLALAAADLRAAEPAVRIPPGDAALSGRIDRYLKPVLEDGHLSGTVLIARGDTVVYERSFGHASYELGVPNTSDAVFNIASITKPMTGIIVRQLVAEKKLDPADSLARWIPSFPRASEITIQHLLDHRAGIPHRVTSEEDETLPKTAADMVALAARAPLLFTPGAQESYSSAGYSVLARVAELASGRSYGELLRERIFAPLGMIRSAHVSSRDFLPGRTTPYLPWPGGGVMPARLKDLSFLVGAGSVWSTPRDLLRLVIALRSGTLDPSSRFAAGERALAWNGSTNGFRAFVDSDPGTGVTVIVASNLMTGALDRLREDLPRMVAGEDVPAPSRVAAPRPVPIETLRRYEGTYALGSEFQVVAHPDGILLSGDRVLIPTGDRTFFSLSDYGAVTVHVSEDGRAEKLEWKIGSRTLEMKRVR